MTGFNELKTRKQISNNYHKQSLFSRPNTNLPNEIESNAQFSSLASVEHTVSSKDLLSCSPSRASPPGDYMVIDSSMIEKNLQHAG